MSFIETPKSWKLGNAKEILPYAPADGEHYVMITNASYDESSKVYDITCKDLNDEGDPEVPEEEREVQREFRLRFWLMNTRDDGALVIDEKAQDNLVKLGKAINGVPCGVPYFKALKKGGFIVKAKLKSLTSKRGTAYTVCNSWSALTKDEAEQLGRIDADGNPLQYYVGLAIPQEEPFEYEEPQGTPIEDQ